MRTICKAKYDNWTSDVPRNNKPSAMGAGAGGELYRRYRYDNWTSDDPRNNKPSAMGAGAGALHSLIHRPLRPPHLRSQTSAVAYCSNALGAKPFQVLHCVALIVSGLSTCALIGHEALDLRPPWLKIPSHHTKPSQQSLQVSLSIETYTISKSVASHAGVDFTPLKKQWAACAAWSPSSEERVQRLITKLENIRLSEALFTSSSHSRSSISRSSIVSKYASMPMHAGQPSQSHLGASLSTASSNSARSAPSTSPRTSTRKKRDRPSHKSHPTVGAQHARAQNTSACLPLSGVVAL
ncbi:hypothetical protein FB45DRAFT_869499 [Roridomyces roridus]|uniref:Uncharacterized protein n=1 Tax=Roridomyces roridus TaxID=1738132 RepID=A0AAD7BLB5_9AGAR|nr:hypothetical protein FB45DRAFT_869499 [Roridomyces roridus]